MSDVLFADESFPDAAPSLRLVSPGLHVEIGTVAARPEKPWAAEIFVPLMTRVSGDIMDRIAGLRLIQQWGAGLEGVDVEAATARGIAVANVPAALAGGAESVAEWCVMSALALSRRLPEMNQMMLNNTAWGGPKGRTLLGRTAGIIGFGGIGKALAALLVPFRMQVTTVTRNPDTEAAAELGVSRAEGLNGLGRLLEDSHFVFLCLPDAPETQHIIGAPQLQRMRSDAVLINAGRGRLVDQAALLRAIDAGMIAGCALDVFSPEPLDGDSALLRRPNILATPHIAGVTDFSYERIAKRFAEAVASLRARTPPASCVNWDKVRAGFYD